MPSFFSGNASFHGGRVTNMTIAKSAMTTSHLDMDMNRITNVKDPVESQDAATKLYVDESIQPIIDEIEVAWNGYLVDLHQTNFSDIVYMQPGSFVVTVQPLTDGAPTATFSISKRSVYDHCHVQRISSGGGPEMLEIRWPPEGHIQLRKNGPGWDGTYAVDFNMKNVSALSNPPTLPDDICTKAYTDHQIRQALDVKFGGIQVHLTGVAFSDVINQRPGSYLITVTSLEDGGPTAVFNLSKSTPYADANIVRVTSSSGNLTGEQLILEWPENSVIVLRKDGPGYDGNYLVDLNLRNFSAVPPPIIPSDVATVDYVNQKVTENCQTQHGGLQIALIDAEYTSIGVNLRPGSYVVTVSPLMSGGASACFALSKNALHVDASIVRITSCKALSSEEELDLVWPSLSYIKLRKTGPFHDGKYLVDFNLKNISTVPLPAVPSDAASMDYVNFEIEKRMQEKFGGIPVQLEDDNWASVAALKCGSYIATVSAHHDGSPTASFFISKSSQTHDGHVFRNTSDPGSETNEQLELSWPANSKLRLRKTGPFHDDIYVVDLNLRNFSAVPESILPTDAATRAFVETSIRERMDLKFGGVTVNLEDDIWQNVAAMKPGSYVVTVSPTFDGGATACFQISKASYKDTAAIQRTMSCGGHGTEEQIELRWDASKKIQIRKTGSQHDGRYLIDFNLKNFQIIPEPPQIDTDTATKAFVEDAIDNRMNASWGGMRVQLIGTEPSIVGALRPGSYIVAITSITPKGPTGTFSISKSSENAEPSIVDITSSPSDSGERLQLLWPSSKKLQLRKTGQFYDGDYVVDCNLKNFQAIPPPVIPSDVCTKEYLIDTLKDSLDVKFGGVDVALTNTEWADIVPLRAGSYIITVSPKFDDGPTCTFHLSKSSTVLGDASVVKISDCPSSTGEQLELVWNGDQKPRLRKTGPFKDGVYIVDFNMKNFASFPVPQIPSDISTRGWVEAQISQAMNVKMGGHIVRLEDTQSSEVFPLRCGSYMVAVSPLMPDGPTAVFSVSKNNNQNEANIVKISGLPGAKSGCQLHLTWPTNGKVTLNKTDSFYDGDYLVDANLKNFTALPPPQIPSDVATRGFVEESIQTKMDNTFSGVKVELHNDDLTPVCPLLVGSYVVTISYLGKGPGPTASFHISKNTNAVDAHVVKATECPGVETDEHLELSWPANKKLQLRKTGPFYDGIYLVSFNVNNVPATREITLPDDIADKSYVDDSIRQQMVAKFGGYPVTLKDSDFSEVEALRPGAYVIAVSSRVLGGPVATFNVTKSGLFDTGHIVRVASSSGKSDRGPGEELEMQWLPNRKLELRKTGPHHDGLYVVDLNLKNLSDVPLVPSVPSDIASKAFVEDLVDEKVSNRLDGFFVNISGMETTEVAPLRIGSYIITVSPLKDGDPAAVFTLSKCSQHQDADVVRLNCSSGRDTGVKLHLEWPAGKKLLIKKDGPFNDGRYMVDANLKNFVTITEPALLPDETASRAFVEETIRNAIDVKFGGRKVQLENSEWTDVCPMKCGSYLVTVSPDFSGGATGTFSICKSNQTDVASVVRINEHPGFGTGEQLELIWDANKQVQLRKTGSHHDGTYIVDFNLKNFSAVTETQLSSDIATRSYVDNFFEKLMQERFSGITTHLEGNQFTDVAAFKSGSYILTVAPRDNKGPTGCYSVSKISDDQDGHIVRLSAFPSDVGTVIEFTWPPFKKLQIRKTGFDNDGHYIVSMDVKNLSVLPPEATMPDDIASRAFVEDRIRDAIDQRFGGVKVELSGLEASPIGNFRPGSYMVTVTGLGSNFPTSTFQISKSSWMDEPSVVRSTSSNGQDGCELNLLWPPNSRLMLQKSLSTCDGPYVVDMNLRNYSHLQFDNIPSDVATKDYVDEKIQTQTSDVRFELTGIAETQVIPFKYGSHVITISGVQSGSPTATFSVSKNASDQKGHVVRLTEFPGAETNERLNLSWPENADVSVSKDGLHWDGTYILGHAIGTTGGPNIVTEEVANGESQLDSNVHFLDISLIGTEPVKLKQLDVGTLHIDIWSDVIPDAPISSWIVLKRKGKTAKIQNVSFDSESAENEMEVITDDSHNIQVRKMIEEYDGHYRIKMF